MKKKHVILLAAILFAALAVVRIAYVNAAAYPQEYRRYEPGAWVDLAGNFLYTSDEETEGYSVKTSGLSLFTAQEFFARYGTTVDEFTAQFDYTIAPEETIALVDVEIKNTKSKNGTLPIGDWSLLNDDYAFATMPEMGCLSYTMPEMGAKSSASLEIGSSYTLHLPYLLKGMSYKDAMRESPYTLVVSCFPVRLELMVETMP